MLTMKPLIGLVALALPLSLLTGCKPAEPTDLPGAYSQGDLAQITAEAKANPASLKARDKAGNTPLHLAVKREDEASVEFLLANGADVNATNELGHTPLFRAVTGDKVGIVKALLANGARTDVTDPQQATPLHIASRRGSKELIELLLEQKANPLAVDAAGRPPILLAVIDGNVSAVETMLSREVPATLGNPKTGTLLHHAAEGDSTRVVELLLEHGAELEAKDPANGRTPLFWAAIGGQTEVVNVLLARKANPAVVDVYGETIPQCLQGLKGDDRRPTHKAIIEIIKQATGSTSK